MRMLIDGEEDAVVGYQPEEYEADSELVTVE